MYTFEVKPHRAERKTENSFKISGGYIRLWLGNEVDSPPRIWMFANYFMMLMFLEDWDFYLFIFYVIDAHKDSGFRLVRRSDMVGVAFRISLLILQILTWYLAHSFIYCWIYWFISAKSVSVVCALSCFKCTK